MKESCLRSHTGTHCRRDSIHLSPELSGVAKIIRLATRLPPPSWEVHGFPQSLSASVYMKATIFKTVPFTIFVLSLLFRIRRYRVQNSAWKASKIYKFSSVPPNHCWFIYCTSTDRLLLRVVQFTVHYERCSFDTAYQFYRLMTHLYSKFQRTVCKRPSTDLAVNAI